MNIEVTYLKGKKLTKSQREVNTLFYDSGAKHYAAQRAWTKTTESVIENSLLPRLCEVLLPGDSILVIGAGTGKDMSLLEKLGYQVKGVDVSMPMLREAKRRKGNGLFQADGRHLPFGKGVFDFVYMEAAGEHMDYSDFKLLIEGLRRVIKPNIQRKANLLINVRRGENENVVKLKDMGRRKYFKLFNQEKYNNFLSKMRIKVIDQWLSYAGTPGVQRKLPFIDTIAKI